MNLGNLIRTSTALVAAAALFGAVGSRADAVPDTFSVSTTISAACTVTDAGPANLTPTYTPSTDTGVGAETVLNTFCNGTTPTVVFTDAAATDGVFVMTSGPNVLYYQISSTPTCSGVPGDNPINEDNQQNLTSGTSAYDICASVLTGVGNNTAPAGTYSDTVTYTITP